MNRTVLDRQLAELKAAVNGMGEQAESAMVNSMAALETGAELTAFTPCGPEQLRRERQRIDSLAALVITLHQPTLGDLRSALGAMSTAGELEQIGNLALKVTARATDEIEVSYESGAAIAGADRACPGGAPAAAGSARRL